MPNNAALTAGTPVVMLPNSSFHQFAEQGVYKKNREEMQMNFILLGGQ